MKKIILTLLLLSCIATVNAQYSAREKDSLKLLLKNEIKDTGRVLLLAELSFAYVESNPDTTMTLALEALSLARRIKFAKGEAESLNRVANAFFTSGNYPKALEAFLQSLKINEKINNQDGIYRNYNNIGVLYNAQEDYRQALDYSFKAKTLAGKQNNKKSLSITLSNIAENYYRLEIFDSARLYAQQAYDVAYQIGYIRQIGVALYLLGSIFSETAQNMLAFEQYRLSFPYLKQSENYLRLCQGYLGFAKLFTEIGKNDSAVCYANNSLISAKGSGFILEARDAARFLSYYYRSIRNADSAFFYQDITRAANDSLFSRQKTLQLQSLAFDEKLRQQEQLAKKLKDAEERKKNLQYAAIALGLVVFVILFLLLSHSIIANQKLIKFLGILALLILFEFINLLIHPYLGRLTNHSPVFMLSIMVGIAALLIPLHHWLETLITLKLVEKNKKIRLAAAKKTIELLEKK